MYCCYIWIPIMETSSTLMTEKCRPETGLKPRVSRYTYERSTD